MIQISLSKSGSPTQQEDKKFHARVQFTEVLSLQQFSEHVAHHNSKYDEADIFAVMKISMSCLQELVKQGYKVSLGALGAFYPTVTSIGTDTMEEFTSDNITSLSINWSRPKALNDFKDGVTFRKVPSRAIQAAMMKTLESGKSDEMLDYMTSLQEGDSAVEPDENGPENGGNTGNNGDTAGGSGEEDPNL